MESTNEIADLVSKDVHDLSKILCTRVEADLAIIGPRITAKIRDSIPDYAAVPLEDHTIHVTEQQRRVLHLLGECRLPNAVDIQRAADLGRLRATQGLGVESLMGAYHIGNLELWLRLNEYAVAERECLPFLTTLMWQSMSILTSEIAAAYATVARAQHAEDVASKSRLIELLLRDELGGEAVDIAQILGFATSKEFVAACISSDSDASGSAARLAESSNLDKVLFVGQTGLIFVLAQGFSEAALEAKLDEIAPDAKKGIGAKRFGLVGARESLIDAQLCLEATSARVPTRRFQEDWLRTCVLSQAQRLEPIISQKREVIVANPHLVETIETYVDQGFSVTETARTMHLHPNSVTYRLERWKSLTGWDPRTFQGLSHSLMATLLEFDI